MSSEAKKGGGGIEKWGPGGEVVQELKDVIWKVGERMADAGFTRWFCCESCRFVELRIHFFFVP